MSRWARSVVMCVLLLCACGEPSRHHESEVQKNSASTAAGPGRPLSATSLSTIEALPVFPEKAVELAWKADLEALCANDETSVHVENFDVTGDGKPEKVCWRLVNGPPNGEYLDLVVVHDGARRQSGYFLLAVSRGVQDGVCPSDIYSVSSEDWTDPEKREFVGIPADWPSVSLTVHNECDPVHLFWPADAEIYGDTDVLFYFARL